MVFCLYVCMFVCLFTPSQSKVMPCLVLLCDGNVVFCLFFVIFAGMREYGVRLSGSISTFSHRYLNQAQVAVTNNYKLSIQEPLQQQTAI